MSKSDRPEQASAEKVQSLHAAYVARDRERAAAVLDAYANTFERSPEIWTLPDSDLVPMLRKAAQLLRAEQ